MIDVRQHQERFPNILSLGLSKREIANRASSPDHFRIVEAAYKAKPDRMAKFSCLYVVSPKGEHVSKIGIAHNPYDRLNQIQCGCWVELEIKALLWYGSFPQAASHEACALKLAAKEGLRLKGEWVDLDHMETIGLVLTAAGNSKRHLRFTDNLGLLDWFNDWADEEKEVDNDWFKRSLEKMNHFRDEMRTQPQ